MCERPAGVSQRGKDAKERHEEVSAEGILRVAVWSKTSGRGLETATMAPADEGVVMEAAAMTHGGLK